jgi:uncharacterized protein YabN with tetrapyrrole methylase and pyrophosphatase domain
VSHSNDSEAAARSMGRIVDLIKRLRGPGGCPWDQEQTIEGTAHYLLEETFEALDAIEAGDVAEACSELGDVMFQVAFLAELYRKGPVQPGPEPGEQPRKDGAPPSPCFWGGK